MHNRGKELMKMKFKAILDYKLHNKSEFKHPWKVLYPDIVK